jgi:hypothetical protein
LSANSLRDGTGNFLIRTGNSIRWIREGCLLIRERSAEGPEAIFLLVPAERDRGAYEGIEAEVHRLRAADEQPRGEFPPAVPTTGAGDAPVPARMRSLQKFGSVHACVSNHFNRERSLSSRPLFKAKRAAVRTALSALIERHRLKRSEVFGTEPKAAPEAKATRPKATTPAPAEAVSKEA